MVTKFKISVEQAFDGLIIGILSQELDYKLALALNRKLHINLSSFSPIFLDHSSSNEVFFSRFHYSNNDHNLSYDLVSNRCGNVFLIKKLKNVDFLFLINNFEDNLEINEVIDKIKEIKSVIAVFNPDVNLIKDKNLQLFNI